MPGKLFLCKVSINKHRNGDFTHPFFRYIRKNILLCIPVVTKPVSFLEELMNDYWISTIKHQPHLLLDLDLPKDVEDLFLMAFMC